MQQLELTVTEKPGLSALSADAKAAGELKEVAALVFPKVAKKDPEKARNDLSDALRPNHARKLEIDEAIEIIVEAVNKTNRSSLLEHIISRLPKDACTFKWTTKEEKIEMVSATLSQMLPQIAEVLHRAQSLMTGERK